MAVILGMCLSHDGAVAAVVDGRLHTAIAHERLTRKKKDTGVSLDMVDYVLAQVGATLADVKAVAFAGYEYRPDNQVRLLTAEGREEIAQHLFDLPTRQQYADCQVLVGSMARPGLFVHHHLSHCASAFYTSPFAQAACFSLDASLFRPEACSLFAYGDGAKLYPLYCPGLMIGNAYNDLTEKLGLGPGLHKAGSTMGLAAYGQVSERARQRWRAYSQSYYARPFMPDDSLFIRCMWSELSGRPPHAAFADHEKDTRPAMDVAASLQFIFEEALVDHAQRLHAETSTYNGNNLCLSGGSFLNCNANTQVLRRTPFERVHLFPACGDDGTAAGAALWAAHHLFAEPRHTYRAGEVAYLGRSYPTPAVGEPVQLDRLAQLLADGGVVAWYQGRAEFGPRALGNRSLLADPRRPGMRDFINARIKRREWFRPLAPSVLADHAAAWFEFDGPSPFMLHTARVRRPQDIPAVTHVDGSARHQTVQRDDNPAYYDLIDHFRRRTDVPLVLNTSLNVNSEPLVETPDDALRFFEAARVHALVINDRMLLHPQPLPGEDPGPLAAR